MQVQDALVILGPFPECIDVDHPEPVLLHYVPFDRQSVPDQPVAGVAEHVLSVDCKHELVQGYPCISGQVCAASEPLCSDDDCILRSAESLGQSFDGDRAPFILQVGFLFLGPLFLLPGCINEFSHSPGTSIL